MGDNNASIFWRDNLLAPFGGGILARNNLFCAILFGRGDCSFMRNWLDCKSIYCYFQPRNERVCHFGGNASGNGRRYFDGDFVRISFKIDYLCTPGREGIIGNYKNKIYYGFTMWYCRTAECWKVYLV